MNKCPIAGSELRGVKVRNWVLVLPKKAVRQIRGRDQKFKIYEDIGNSVVIHDKVKGIID